MKGKCKKVNSVQLFLFWIVYSKNNLVNRL